MADEKTTAAESEFKAVIPALNQDNLTSEEKMARAAEAQRLLQHPLLRQAFANLKLDYFEAFCKCPPEKIHERDRIFHCAAVIEQVQTHLSIILTQGKLEEAHIQRAARGRDR